MCQCTFLKALYDCVRRISLFFRPYSSLIMMCKNTTSKHKSVLCKTYMAVSYERLNTLPQIMICLGHRSHQRQWISDHHRFKPPPPKVSAQPCTENIQGSSREDGVCSLGVITRILEWKSVLRVAVALCVFPEPKNTYTQNIIITTLCHHYSTTTQYIT